ncbi:hypothetical protein FO519_000861 [Halicephalobus sp. NKZ332]|nr:hypothetical protein FO519_000861 [Halicephalobus sp. NKZ332]
MFMISDYDTALVMLLSVTVIGVDITFMAWVNWSLYIHYCFLRGVEINAKKLGQRADPNKRITSLMGVPCETQNGFKII